MLLLLLLLWPRMKQISDWGVLAGRAEFFLGFHLFPTLAAAVVAISKSSNLQKMWENGGIVLVHILWDSFIVYV